MVNDKSIIIYIFIFIPHKIILMCSIVTLLKGVLGFWGFGVLGVLGGILVVLGVVSVVLGGVLVVECILERRMCLCCYNVAEMCLS